MTTTTSDTEPAFELKGTVSTLTVVRLLSSELESIDKQLRDKVGQLPNFFRYAPIVLDLEQLPEAFETADLANFLSELSKRLKDMKLVPVGVQGARDEDWEQIAAEQGLGPLRGGGPSRLQNLRLPDSEQSPKEEDSGKDEEAAEDSESTEKAESSEQEAVWFQSGMVVSQPVRGGQIVYAQQRDLVILAPVNAGAEVIADGNIHVYSALRGRALAGAHGNEDARIFCKQLQAELVSIAGEYLRADEIAAQHRDQPVQVYLKEGKVVIDALRTT